jgi:NADH:ubiquinone oxidoreductase subunit 3 (subunit A)
MEAELYSRIATALGIALIVSYAYLGISYAWGEAAKKIRRRQPFAEHILFEAGYRVRQQLANLDTRYFQFLGSFLVFVLVLITVLILHPGTPPIDVASWVWLVVSIVFFVAAMYLPFQTVRLKRTRSRLNYRRSANMAVGHSLQRISSKGYAIFHEVRAGNHIIDNVVVGAKGAYAVNVFVLDKARGKDATARFNDSSLIFGNAKTTQPVSVSVNRVGSLGKELSKVVGHSIRVRSVIAVPGWNVASTGTDRHLLVNEKTVVMLTGWTDPETYLMDEDVDKIQEYLTGRCSGVKQIPT